MKNVTLKKASEKGVEFHIFNEANQLSGILLCVFSASGKPTWMKTGTIPEEIFKNRSKLENEAKH